METICRGAKEEKGVNVSGMIGLNIRRTRVGVPILKKDEINDIGDMVVRDFCPEVLKEPQAVDIDLLVQDYLKMEQDFQYLSHCGVYLGMTVFNDTNKVPVYNPVTDEAEYISAKAHTVIIDNSLLESNQEHRYRFTMGHEAGHEVFHIPYFHIDPNQMTIWDFIEEDSPAMVQCRVDGKKSPGKNPKLWSDAERMEWQANAFSAAVLMPKTAVDILMRRVIGSNKKSPYLFYVEMAEVSEVFNVSQEAAYYRLQDLKYIPRDVSLQHVLDEIDCYLNCAFMEG
ncbi:MAG: ImmA/IrrE family metallo-endopeptidase [Clostridiales bacterium]|nr:ImmA/IrrE family metallo-endopeptidase [Clostridiales bacterium]